MVAYAKCVECGKLAKPATGARLYPRREDLHHLRFYLCECGAYCGVHPNGRPLGSPGNSATRQARMKAHRAFDRLWKDGPMNRKDAYRWLSGATGIDPLNCHIGMMTKPQADNVVKLVRVHLETARHEAKRFEKPEARASA